VQKFIRIGVDLAKNYFQIHALGSEGAPAVTRKMTRVKMREFFSRIEPCLVGMEACGTAHYWARELKSMGHEVLLMPPTYTKPYVKRGKNDAADADAICEAMSRPGMRFVPIKSAEQQAMLMLHKTRELLVKQRTMSVNALRGHLSEFGIVAAKGIGRVDELLDLAEIVGIDGINNLPQGIALLCLIEILWGVDSDQRSGRVRLRNHLLWRRPCQP
jgi:transposase